MFFHGSFPLSCSFFKSELTFSTQRQKWCSHIQNRTGKTWYKSSRSLMFCKIGVLNFTGKHLFWSLFLKRLQGWGPATLSKGDSNTGISVEVFEIFKDISFFTKHLRWLLLVIISLRPGSLPLVNKRFRLTQRVSFLSQPIIYSFIDDKNKETLIKKFFRLS